MNERAALLTAIAAVRDGLLASAKAEGLVPGMAFRGQRGTRRHMLLTRADAASGRVTGRPEVPLAALAERGFPYERIVAIQRRGEAIGYILSDRHRHPSTFVLRPEYVAFRNGRLEVRREAS